MKRYCAVLFGISVFSFLSLAASSYVMMSDADLVAQAELIVVGKISSVTTGFSDQTVTRYGVDVQRTLKGRLGATGLQVIVPGGLTSSGSGRYVYGAPQFKQGERAILFLMRHPDGSYGILQLMLGAFHEVNSLDQHLAVRNLSEATELPATAPGVDRSVFKRPRDFDRFADWIAATSLGISREMDYFSRDVPPQELGRAVAPFTLFDGFNGQNHPRWFDFDQSKDVLWHPHTGGQAGLSDKGQSELMQAMAAWDDDTGSNIRYVLSSETSASMGLKKNDGTNTILFGDPNDEIDGSFDCNSGGIEGVGGPFFTNETRNFKGEIFNPIVEGDVVIQDGVECLFTGANGPAEAAELYAHELGHSLGIGHSCGDSKSPACSSDPVLNDAIMRATTHGGGRGAQLGEDDRSAIAFLYGQSTAGPGSATFFFPQVADGAFSAGGISSQFKTTIDLNNSGDTTTVTVDFFSTPNGAPMSVNLGSLGSGSNFQFQMGPGDTVSLETSGTGGLKVGYVRVTAGSGVSGTAIFTRLDNGIPVTKAGVPAAMEGTSFSIFADTRQAVDSGMAIVYPPAADNSSKPQAHVTLRLYDDTATLMGTANLNPMSAGAHQARFVTEIFKNAPGVNEMLGSVTVQSDQPIVIVSLLQDDDQNVPFPQDVPILTAFQPLSSRFDAAAMSGSLTLLPNGVVQVTTETRGGQRQALGAVYRIFDKKTLLIQRVTGAASGRSRLRLRIPASIDPARIRATVQYLFEDGAGPQMPLFPERFQ